MLAKQSICTFIPNMVWLCHQKSGQTVLQILFPPLLYSHWLHFYIPVDSLWLLQASFCGFFWCFAPFLVDCCPYLVWSLINLISIVFPDPPGVLSTGYFGVSEYAISGYDSFGVLDDVRTSVKGSVGVWLTQSISDVFSWFFLFSPSTKARYGLLSLRMVCPHLLYILLMVNTLFFYYFGIFMSIFNVFYDSQYFLSMFRYFLGFRASGEFYL
jgi:hypothetical protein